MDNNFIKRLKLKPQRKKKRRWAWVLLVILTAVGISGVFNQSRGELVSPMSKKQEDKSLKGVIENALESAGGVYGIAVNNLKTGEKYYLNENKRFETGSLYKLWVMATVYKQIQEGKLTADQALSGDIAALNKKFNIDPEDAEFTEGKVNFTVQSALTQMITISHNYAALVLTEKIKLSTVAVFLKENGFNESAIGTDDSPPVSTPFDIALFYEKLYRGELANQQYTEEMINLLKNQQLNNGLPKYLPAGLSVAHKTGDLGWFKHDAGIVYPQSQENLSDSEKGDYIIVILSESNSPLGAQERIALISKAVYDYFLMNPKNIDKK